MTNTDFLSLTPFMILAMAPIIIMIVISIYRNYEVVFGFSVLAFTAAIASIFYILPIIPHSIAPLFIIDRYSLFFLGIILISALLVTLLSYTYLKQLDGIREEYYIIIFTSTLGASLLAVANHFILFFLGIETLTLSLYILIAFEKSKKSSIEAGIKYLILASVSSAFLLFGMGLMYMTFGTMQFSVIVSAMTHLPKLPPLFIYGFGMMLVGIGFKLALVPFHMWTPDVYQGAPAPISSYIATVSKGAVMAVFIRFFFSIKGFENQSIFMVITGIAILSMFVGNILAIQQKNIKRLLAYSSIANMGYLIIILLTGSDKGIQSAIFYLITYFITTIGAFGVISLLSTKDFEMEEIIDFKGLFWKKPWTAAVLTLCMLSLAGIPITAGFIAKFYLILEGMKAGLLILIFAMIINSVIGLYYYLRVINTMFSTANNAELPIITILGKLTLAIISIVILVLGIYPGWLIDIIVKYVVF